MEALLISTSDSDGGAARAAYRLHRGLRDRGISSQMLVRLKLADDQSVISAKTWQARLGSVLDSRPLNAYPQRDRTLFSTQWFPDTLLPKVTQLRPDIINLHWACNGYLQIETLPKFRQPVVWTLHDMWAFTGGCHYTQTCDRYQQSCGKCPQLHSHKDQDLSRQIWRRKAKAWQGKLAENLTIVTPSHWLAQCAKNSSLLQQFPVEVIPNGLDTELYRPIDRQTARAFLRLPQDKKLILFGALGVNFDTRKGFQFLQAALQQLKAAQVKPQDQNEIELVVFGGSQPDNPVDLGFKAHYLGRLHDDLTLALSYAAADVMVVPSSQEAFGQTASESLACGTPVVAFNVTGLKDIVDHQHNGYLAQAFDSKDLAHGIDWVLADDDRAQRLRQNAREKAIAEFTLPLQAQRYSSLFAKALDQSIH